jgi:hypothetical protein
MYSFTRASYLGLPAGFIRLHFAGHIYIPVYLIQFIFISLQNKNHEYRIKLATICSHSIFSNMPHIRHHRRHHTWPQCGSELFMREPRGLEIHVSKLGGGPLAYIPLSFQQAMAAPLSTEEMLCGDMGMPELSRQPKRMPRLWFRSSTKGRNDQITLSGSSGQTKLAYRSVLRRLTRRPPLNKTRSLVVVPSNMRTGDTYTISGLVAPRDLAKQAVFSDSDRVSSSVARADAARSMAERRHRRCHSEQPHAWRKPSATLWTLQEHEE